MSEDNVKANGMGCTKWTYHKEQSFTSSIRASGRSFYPTFNKIFDPFRNIIDNKQTPLKVLDQGLSFSP